MITADTIIAEVRRIAAENPEFVYDEGVPGEDGFNRCFYWRGGRPSCIFGRALFNLGVNPDALVDADNDGSNGLGIVGLLERLAIPMMRHVEGLWMTTVQYAQDQGGISWSAAVDQADRCHPLGA